MTNALRSCLVLLTISLLTLAACAPTAKQAPAPVITENAPIPTPVPQDNSVKIALLLPLSGPAQQVGNAMLDAAQLALFSTNMPSLTLIPIDTEGGDAKIAENTRQAIARGARIIIGPLFSQNTAVAARVAKAHNVNVLSFSNDTSLAGNGVFLLGFILEEQVQRVADYAMAQGINEFYILAPATPYGRLATEHLRNIVVQNSGTIDRTEFYTASGQNLALTVENIATAINNNRSDTVKALFIPEGGEKLATITNLLAKYPMDYGHLRLLGTGQWDDISSLKNPQLEGGWFASVSPEQHALFEESFKRQYGYKPLRIASLAYDAIALAYSIANQPQGASFNKATLTNPRGFAGIDGIFRLKPTGITERKLAVLQITDGQFQVIAPPDTGFEARAGY